MRAMILAAGRGERMRPLTDHTPKPLLQVRGKPLIVWHIERLVAAGITELVINHAWLGSQIESALGSGADLGACIHYSPESGHALETAGGISQALPLLGQEPFLVVNGDVWCDWNPAQAYQLAQRLSARQALAWLVLVPNPDHHLAGDFYLADNSLVRQNPETSNDARVTFSGIGVYQPSLFDTIRPGERAALGPVLRNAMKTGLVCGQLHDGRWTDVGTPERLQSLNNQLSGWHEPGTQVTL